MCGILALWYRDGTPIDRAALARGVGALSRRGPDDEGYLLLDTRTGRFVQCRGSASDSRVDLPTLDTAGDHRYDLALGHRRLSIVDLSPAGHQPMSARDGSLWIVFNGMIHNFRDLREQLQALGHRFESRTDTEVILHAYAAWGTACVERFNGMWAFVLWDGHRQQLFASRDRLGIKPLLAATAGPLVAFASELKALRPVPDLPLELDPVAVHHYLSLMKVPAPFTIYRQVRKMMPGHSARVDHDDFTEWAYWRLDPSHAPELNQEDAAEQIAALLEDSIRLRLIADVPMGALLSGGVDSSIVTAMAAAGLPPGDLTCFTLGFPNQPDVDETRWAGELAAHLGVQHHVVEFSAEFLEDLPSLVALFDEPFAVSSALGVYRLAQEAARHTKVLLTGDGGDELFAGYLHRHAQVDELWDRIDRQPFSRFRGARAGAAAERVRWRTPSMGELLRLRWRSLVVSRQRARDRSFNARRALFNQAEKQALYTPGWRDLTRGAETLTWLGTTLPPPDGDRLTRWQVHDVRTSLHDEMLTKVDRATMASGVEARPPLLDHRLVEMAVNLPAGLKLRDGAGKWILRKVGERYVPPGLFDRPKGGFTIPLSHWFGREWRGLLGDALAPAALRRVGVLRPEAVQAVLAHHDAHPGFTTAHMVYTLLCFQIWHDVFHRS